MAKLLITRREFGTKARDAMTSAPAEFFIGQKTAGDVKIAVDAVFRWADVEPVAGRQPIGRVGLDTAAVDRGAKPCACHALTCRRWPNGTPRPPDDMLAPGSMVFTPPDHAVPLDRFDQCSQRLGASVNVTNHITSHGSRPAKTDGNGLIDNPA